jgi:hypothetical protein
MTLKTKLHFYRFDAKKDAVAYAALHEQLSDGRHFFNVNSDPKNKWDDTPRVEEVELEMGHLFADQWNTKDGRRVFDWYEGIVWINGRQRDYRAGHWLEITPEMRELRRNTNVCGYCGKYEPAVKGSVFHLDCLDSEYLKESELHLLRMLPVDQFMPKRAPLTEAERAYLLPLFTKAQIEGSSERGAARIAKARRDIAQKAAKAIENATTERAGLLWLLDHGINTDNVIYYPHTGRFCFGWRKPLSESEYSALVEKTTEFLFDYDIQRE